MPPGAEGSGRGPLRRGRRAALVFAIAWRFLRGHGSGLVDGTARAAWLATTLGVAAMVVAMALMSGYRRDLEQKLFSGGASLMAYPLGGTDAATEAELRHRLAGVDGVGRVRHVAYGQGALAGGAVSTGIDVSLRGVNGLAGVERMGRLTLGAPAPGEAGGGPFAGSPPGVVAGADLARRLEVAPGEVLRLMVLGTRGGRPQFRFRSVRLAGTFASGFSEFDRRLVVVDRELLLELAGEGSAAEVYEIEADRPGGAGRLAEVVEAALGPQFAVRDWRELNSELFTALRLQQVALFFVLGLIVLVATFNVASTLVVLVRDRMREIGVLAALGLGPRGLEGVFLTFGGLLSLTGTLAGVALGSGAAWILTRFELIRFDAEVAEVYFLSSVSFQVRPIDLVAVVVFTLGVTALACWLPARRASRILPAHALRYE